ncbi:MAG: hypothetical protein ACYTF9_05730, partial [Planctomycetota bacterium]
GVGPENKTANHTGPLYSSMVAKDYFNTDLLIGPTEVNPAVQEYREYDYTQYEPSNDDYWDSGLTAQLNNGICHTSFMHLALCGQRKKLKWQDTQNSGDPMLSTRGTQDGILTGNEYKLSPVLELHGPRKEWVGNICYNDNHAETSNSFYPTLVTYEALDAIDEDKDNIFAAEFEDYPAGPMSSGDAFLVICTAAAGNGNSVTPVWDELID